MAWWDSGPPDTCNGPRDEASDRLSAVELSYHINHADIMNLLDVGIAISARDMCVNQTRCILA